MAAEVVAFPSQKKPQRVVSRAERRHVEYIGRRMAETHTPREQFDVAVDFLRATEADHKINGTPKAVAAMAHLTQLLIDTAEKLAPRRSR